jgi:hypothetical protein
VIRNVTRILLCGSALLGCARVNYPPVGVDPSTIDGSFSGRVLADADWDALVGGIKWVDGEDADRCVDPGPSCRNGRTVKVNISVNADAWKVDPRNLPASPGGIAVVRMFSRGIHETANYHVKPGAYRYYFFVSRNSASQPVWELKQRDLAGHYTTVDGPWRFPGCWDHPPATTASARFYDCTRRAPPPFGKSASRSPGQLELPSLVAVSTPFQISASWSTDPHEFKHASTMLVGESAAWFACVAGCCTLDQI